MNNNCATEVVQERDFITTKKYNCYNVMFVISYLIVTYILDGHVG